MTPKIEYQINPRENVYFGIRVFFSVLIYLAIIFALVMISSSDASQPSNLLVIVIVLAIGLLFVFFSLGLLVGRLKGNAVRVNEKQFPDIYAKVANQSDLLGLSKVPRIYILQSGGLLNAFATRFLGSNYIVLFSEVVESAYEQDKNVMEFIIGHELGHIKRKHMIKNLLLFPSAFVPFLFGAYSRACEYTCDNIGFSLCPEGAQNGLLLLASGRSLFKKINAKEYVNQSFADDGFWFWISEKLSSHPHLTKRLEVLSDKIIVKPSVKVKTQVEPTSQEPEKADVDYSKYMPK